MNNHDMHDDTASFAMSRFHPIEEVEVLDPIHPRLRPAEACTELGADPDRAGCGPEGKGLGPMAWLLVAVLGLVLVFGTVHFAVGA